MDRLQVFLSLLKESHHEEKDSKDKKSHGNHENNMNISEEAPLLQSQSFDNGASRKHGGMQFAALLNKRFINCKR